MSEQLQATERTRLRRMRERGQFDRDTIDAILDAMPMCHIGYQLDGHPVVMPTIQWREDDHVYWHASRGGRGIKAMQDHEVCLTVSLLDGLVLARSGLHHSANFRSVMVFGTPARVEDPEQKKLKLDRLIDSLYPGRSSQLRPITESELARTTVLGLPISEASAKIRRGGPVDDEADYELPIWSGVIPIRMRADKPKPDPRNLEGLDVPAYAERFDIG